MELTNYNKDKKLRRKAIPDLSSMMYGKVPPQAKELEEAVSASDDNAKNASNVASVNNSGYVLRGRVFDAIGVEHTTQESEKKDAKKAEKQDSRNAPLVVVDGKPIANSKKSGEEIVSELDKEAFDTVYLKEPLYIINGAYYSEESLFGKNPTSPYAPLDKQEIKTIKILQDENATAVYGEKGKKGVVIITTKTGNLQCQNRQQTQKSSLKLPL